LNDGSEGADAAGKVFHISAAAMGKARSPIGLCFNRGTTRTRTAVDADRSEVRLKDTTALNCAGIERQAPPDGKLFAPDN